MILPRFYPSPMVWLTPYGDRPITYDCLFRHGQKGRNLLRDESWTPVLLSDVCPNQYQQEELIGEIAVCSATHFDDLLFQVGERVAAAETDLKKAAEFHRPFAASWFRGTTPDGPIPKLMHDWLLGQPDHALNHVALFYIANRWERINTRQAHLEERMEVKQLRRPRLGTLAWRGESDVKVCPQSFGLATPGDVSFHSSDMSISQFRRIRGTMGHPGYSAESVLAIFHNDEPATTISPSLVTVVREETPGVRKGWLDVVNVLVAFLRKTSHPDPDIWQVSFPLHRSHAAPHIAAVAQKRFSGLLYQTPGLQQALIRRLGNLDK